MLLNQFVDSMPQHLADAEAKAKEIEIESNAENARRPNPALAYYNTEATGSNVTFTYVKKRTNRSSASELHAEGRLITAEILSFSCAKAANMPEFQWGLNFTYVFKTSFNETITVIPVDAEICSSMGF